MSGDGRNQVAPDDVIASSWGNAIADRTIQTYANVADRDGDLDAPQDGAVVYTKAEDEFWFRVASHWLALGLGVVASADGPDDRIRVKDAQNIVSIFACPFQARLHHKYLISAVAEPWVGVDDGRVKIWCRDNQGDSFQMFASPPGVTVPVGATDETLHAAVTFLYTPTVSGAASCSVRAQFFYSGKKDASLIFEHNSCHLAVIDVGTG